MLKIDFIDYKTIIRYLIIFAIILTGGSIAKDGFAVCIVLMTLYYIVKKDLYRAIEVFFIWFFIYGFFIGQGFISINVLSKYVIKPSFFLFIIFLFFIDRIPVKLLKARFITTWIIFLLLSLWSSVIQGQSPFTIITVSSFFLMYLLVQAKGIRSFQYQKLLNLFVAAAILQTIVSFLQISQIIPPSFKMMDDSFGGQVKWVPGLDDIASGTFGTGSSHITSWYAALISLFLILVWSLTRRKEYLYFTAIILLQFAMVDSKIVIMVTMIMFVYFLFFLFKNQKIFHINTVRYLFFVCIFAIGTLGFYKAWNLYYEYFSAQTGSNTRAGISAVYKNMAQGSINAICDNIKDWGKIRGFQYVYEDFSKNNECGQLIWGYGMQGYNFNDKMGLIESKDSPLMQMDNLTRSRSGLISQFAKSGLVGSGFFVLSIYFWFLYNYRSNLNQFNLIKKYLLKIFLFFSILLSFLYPITITAVPIIVFAAIISIYTKMIQKDILIEILSRKADAV